MPNFWQNALQDSIAIGMAMPGLFAVVFTSMWFGVSNFTPMVASAIIAYPYLAQNVYQGVDDVYHGLLELSSSFGVSQSRLTRRVVIQSVLQGWFAGVRYAFSGGANDYYESVCRVVMGSSMGSPIDDIAYLARSEHRAPTLVALTVRPRSRSELWEMTGVSSSTIRRTLSEFEERNWIRRKEYKYETTPLGAFVASAVAELIERVETERKLRDVWHLFPGEESGFTVEMCADAVVTVARADDPYRPVNRFVSLLRETDRLRFVGLDVAMLEPCKEELCQRIVDGVEAEIINPPRVANYVRSTCPDLFSEALESGNLTVRLHDDLPSYGVGLFDDRIAISAYDPDSVTVRVLVDTDDPDAREWAESIYTSYWRQTPTLPLEPSLE